MQARYTIGQKVTVMELTLESFIGADRIESTHNDAGEPWLKPKIVAAGRSELPSSGGIVCMVLQRTRDLRGFVKIRWGDRGSVGHTIALFGEGGLESM